MVITQVNKELLNLLLCMPENIYEQEIWLPQAFMESLSLCFPSVSAHETQRYTCTLISGRKSIRISYNVCEVTALAVVS